MTSTFPTKHFTAASPRINKAYEKLQFLTHAEQKGLIRLITRLTEGGYPRHATLHKMAQYIRECQTPSLDASSMSES